MPLIQAYLELARGNPAQVVELLENTDCYNFDTGFRAVTEQGIYFGADKTTIEFFSFATGKVTPVAVFSPDYSAGRD